MSERSGLMPITTDIFAAPTTAFENLKSKGRIWFPLALLILFGSASQALYFYLVDFNWFTEYAVAVQGQDVAPAIQEQTRDMVESLGKGVYTGIAIASAVLLTPIIMAVFAVFYLIVSNIRNDNLTFGQCYSLVTWSSLVSLVSGAIGLVLIITSNGQIEPEQARGLSLNTLLFHVEVGQPWYSWLSTFDLTYLWSATLIAIGYRKWTGASLNASIVIGTLPTILIFGIWAAFI